MNDNVKNILAKCDHTLLGQTSTWEEIQRICDDGIRYSTASVCIPPCYVKQAKDYVGERLKICTVIGFPNGYDTTAAGIDEYIRKNLGKDITVDSLCREFNISPKRLYAISHKNFGVPIGEYIGTVRIGEAKRLLESTDLSIQQIAYSVGIEDYNYFSKFFKLRVGLPPLKYRKEFPFHIHNNK